ncbi:MAG: Holliday junction branch migration protein RuvA [Gemmatimonadota bacterium]|nr:Holliday junction branch migration protein RuvA [Gemmatimonadota bacterium]MDE2984418.1 Holliday junction branch migration protein RuvA [Gemmatimonadota bacterium]
MITRIRGRLLSLDTDRVEIETAAGLVYEVHVPLSIFHRLPAAGTEMEILTAYVVQDEKPHLYGFIEEHERTLFHRLLGAHKVGPRLALAMMSTYNAGRLARLIAGKNALALMQVVGLGKKTAERVILDLADKVEDIAAADTLAGPEAKRAAAAVAALTGLGYSFAEADAAVREASRENGDRSTEEIVRSVLARRTSQRQ